MRHRRGFTLFELLFAVSLLALLAVVVRPVLRWTVRSMSAPPATALRLDAAVDDLRHDVWAATAVTAPSPHELSLVGPGARTVTWHVGPGDALRRSTGPSAVPATTRPAAGDRAWAGLFPDATVTADGAAVRLTVAGDRGRPGRAVVLPSQVALLTRGMP